MFGFLRKKNINTTEVVDEIERTVYAWAKPLGFRKHGRVLHRFVDGDISQVIHFQNGCPEKGVRGVMWVNLGIRIPECASFPEETKAYYQEYECTVRCSLDEYVDKTYNPYPLSADPQKTAADIIQKLEQHVLPVFDVLSTRQSIVEHLKDYPDFNSFRNHLVEQDVNAIRNHI